MAQRADSLGPSATGTSPQQGVQLKNIVEIAIERNYCTAAQVAEARMDLAESGSKEDIGNYLVQKKILTDVQLRACERAVRGPTIIAGFEILEKVGQGGMGAVFRARQMSMDRVVAVKILSPKLAQDPTFKQRFLQEARISAKLSHLNIINGIDCGEVGGYTYFAMEFVDGRTVKQILKEKGKLPPSEALEIVRQITEALVYAQSYNLVHRDIKPDNIMMTSTGTAKLCDLGLAKETKNDDASLTQSGQAVGTPHFISPEQARGDRNVDARSDIYSLGASFYQMIVGKVPFDAPTSASVMALHITEEAKNPCDLDPQIPSACGQIISKMMAKAPADRYASAQELLEDLESAKAGRPVKAAAFRAKSSCLTPKRAGATAQQSPVPERTSIRGTSRHQATKSPIPLAAIGGLVVLVLIAYIAFGRGKTETPPVPPPVQPKTEVAVATKKAEPPVTPPPPPAQKIEKPEPDKKPVPLPPPAETAQKTPKPEEKPDKKPEPAKAPPEVSATTAATDPEKLIANLPTPTKAIPAADVPKDLATSVALTSDVEVKKAEPTADMLYARFLSEEAKILAKTDLQKAQSELRDLSTKSDFSICRDDVNNELKDAAAALTFEQNAMKARAAAGGTVELSEETAKKFEATKGKVSGFDPNRGLSVEVNSRGAQIGLYIPASAIAVPEIIKYSPDGAPLSTIRYLCARGNVADAKTLLDQLKGAEKDRFERKLRLMGTSETELMADAVFKNLEKIAEARSWKLYKELAEEFDKLYGKTNVASENVVKLLEWKAAAKAALTSVEGLESAGNFFPVNWPGINACTVKIADDSENKNKYLSLESPGGNGDRSGAGRLDLKALELANKKEIVFRASHDCADPLQIAVGFVLGAGQSEYFETAPVTVQPGGWYENHIKIDGKVLKTGSGTTFDNALPRRDAIHMMIVVVYGNKPYKIKIDGMVLK